jgi:hypothetical protein
VNKPFDIPLVYKNKERSFRARLLLLVYTHRFVVDVYGREIFFGPDEERNYRAIVEPEVLEQHTDMDAGLLKAIAEAIEMIVK